MARTKKAQREAATTAGEQSKTGEDAQQAKVRGSTRRKKATKRVARSPKMSASRKRLPRTRRRKRYTDAERAKILATAQREGFTGAQVKERFGVSALSYYQWRKKAKAPKRAGRPRKLQRAGIDLESQVRAAVRERIQELLPLLIRQQAASLLANGRRRA